MKPPLRRPPKARSLRQRLVEGLIWLDKELECGLLDLGLFLRGERRVVTAEMILVFLVQLILMIVLIVALVVWGVFLKRLGIGG